MPIRSTSLLLSALCLFLFTTPLTAQVKGKLTNYQEHKCERTFANKSIRATLGLATVDQHGTINGPNRLVLEMDNEMNVESRLYAYVDDSFVEGHTMNFEGDTHRIVLRNVNGKDVRIEGKSQENPQGGDNGRIHYTLKGNSSNLFSDVSERMDVAAGSGSKGRSEGIVTLASCSDNAVFKITQRSGGKAPATAKVYQYNPNSNAVNLLTEKALDFRSGTNDVVVWGGAMDRQLELVITNNSDQNISYDIEAMTIERIKMRYPAKKN